MPPDPPRKSRRNAPQFVHTRLKLSLSAIFNKFHFNLVASLDRSKCPCLQKRIGQMSWSNKTNRTFQNRTSQVEKYGFLNFAPYAR